VEAEHADDALADEVGRFERGRPGGTGAWADGRDLQARDDRAGEVRWAAIAAHRRELDDRLGSVLQQPDSIETG
jgi:selenocysteine lyase/cysteine desulfurase